MNVQKFAAELKARADKAFHDEWTVLEDGKSAKNRDTALQNVRDIVWNKETALGAADINCSDSKAVMGHKLLDELAQHVKAVKQEQKRAANNSKEKNNPQVEGNGIGMHH